MNDKKKIYSTPSQTVGPFFGNYLNFNKKKFPFKEKRNIKLKFKKVIVSGNIIYNKNNILHDGFIEYWQELKYNDKNNFLNFNRTKTNEVKKNKFILFINQYNQINNANHVNLIIFGRGILNHLYTKIYFEDDKYYKNDFFYKSISNKRRSTLIANLINTKNDIKYYSFNIFLNGINETLFFDNYELY